MWRDAVMFHVICNVTCYRAVVSMLIYTLTKLDNASFPTSDQPGENYADITPPACYETLQLYRCN